MRKGNYTTSFVGFLCSLVEVPTLSFRTRELEKGPYESSESSHAREALKVWVSNICCSGNYLFEEVLTFLYNGRPSNAPPNLDYLFTINKQRQKVYRVCN